ncbi:putative glycosyltransferase [Dorcoceras hygrometricum]|uniref:Putative glycosyltransferase n=1 Tax=Dorcoceras hygrometricum TaxID=472368 RepID=A0A2Z7D5I7_9LAMI|nr:putative glycosyltransferase [Dorcoceras hygrometricum]
MLSDLHLFVLEELTQQVLAHDLRWDRTCCSQIFEGRPRDRGAVIARNSTNTPSKFWIRMMIRVDGVWAVEPSADHWVKIPRPVVLNEVPRQCSYVDFLPSLIYSVGFLQRIFAVLWALLLQREPFCEVYRFTLSTDSQHVQLPSSLVFESPLVQIEQSAAFAGTAGHDISNDYSLHFDDNDAATASISLPAAPIPDITEALNQLRASIEQISERDDGAKLKDTLLMHLHGIEQRFTARFDAQDRVLGALRKDSNDQRSLLSLDLKSSHKQLGTQIATTALGVVDVRRVVREHYQELNAKITSLDEQVAATRNDLLDFRAQAQQTLNIITDQLNELVAYINRGGNDKNGEVSSSRSQPPPDDRNRDIGNIGGGGDTDRSIVENS